MQQLPLALILIKFPNNSKGICVNIRVKASLNIAYRSGPRIMILGASGVGHPRVSDLVLKQQTIESLVKVLKTDILWAHTFVVAFMEQHNGPLCRLV